MTDNQYLYNKLVEAGKEEKVKSDRALAIMNEFVMHPYTENPYPGNDFWLRKLAILCDRVATAETGTIKN